MDALWKSPNEVVDLGAPLRKMGARCTVRFEWEGRAYVLKHYIEPTRRHTLKQNVSRSRARTTWNTAVRLIEAGIATPHPLACIENRFGPFRGDSFLMYPYVEGQTLASFLGNEDVQRNPLLEMVRHQLVSLWSQLRQVRIALTDTNLKNFIISRAGQLWVIDVDKVRFHRLALAADLDHRRAWHQFSRSASKSGLFSERILHSLDGPF
jgi:tRNA A-37 threonylcarbamoyl transferase component Bud32